MITVVGAGDSVIAEGDSETGLDVNVDEEILAFLSKELKNIKESFKSPCLKLSYFF